MLTRLLHVLTGILLAMTLIGLVAVPEWVSAIVVAGLLWAVYFIGKYIVLGKVK